MLLLIILIGLGCHILIMKLLDEMFPSYEDEMFEVKCVSFIVMCFFLLFSIKLVMP